MKIENQLNFAILGGDKRNAVVAQQLASTGHNVKCFAVVEADGRLAGCEICATADKAMEDVDIAILPLPVSRDGVHLSSSSQKIMLCDIVKLAKKNKSFLLGGLVPPEFYELCKAEGLEIIDYYMIESLQQKNALPSAEGAVMIAMEHTDITVRGMKVLISGYGRIGKILADILRKLGAIVTVAARRDETLCELSLAGFDAVRADLTGLSSVIEVDVIFNTTPALIFNEEILKNYKKHPLYIEIASAPGGIDGVAARDLGIEIINAQSLPGKYSPKSAGKYVYETITEILSERRNGT